jgi:glutathione S-transferase
MHSGFPTLRDQSPMNCGLRIKLNEITTLHQKDITRIDELWNQGLRQFNGPFLAGSKFTAVDAFYTPVVFRIRTYGLHMSPTALKYVDFLLAFNRFDACLVRWCTK